MDFEVNHLFIRFVSICTLVYIIRLIYAHNLRIGSSWFLLVLGTSFFVLSIWPDSIEILSLFTGTNSWASNILFFFVIFLFIIVVHCTIMISGLINCVKELGQELTLLASDIDEEKIKKEAGSAHAIETATVHPLVANDLNSLPIHAPCDAGREGASESNILSRQSFDKLAKRPGRHFKNDSIERNGHG